MAANVLKNWLRQLPPSDRLLGDVDAARLARRSHASDGDVASAVAALPPARRSALLCVLELGAALVARKHVNLMTKENLAICLAPTLVGDPDITDPGKH